MLWTKESNEANALYVNIFTLKGKVSLNRFHSNIKSECRERDHETCIKSDETALKKRKEGNQLFAECQWVHAIELYNESLCYAKPESDHISLAYANRSACFIHMKMYRECLIDIELAKKFGFPADKMQKLDERKADCLKHIDNGVNQSDSRVMMDFNPDDQFPCMANVLKFERNADGSRSVIAKEDIDVGQTIAVEKAFTTCLYMCYGWRCNICMKRNTNLVPCTKCTVAVFCHGTCDKNAIHEYECGLKFMGKSQVDGIMMNLSRLIFKLIDIFLTADELMAFVETVINGSDSDHLPDTLTDDKSKYGAFLKLSYLRSLYDNEYFFSIIFSTYKKVLDIPKVIDVFTTLKHRRFLMHLMALHALITDQNSIRVRYGMSFNNENNIMCSHTSLISGHFGHSCAPNVFWGDYDGHNVFITIRPVKKGEPLHTFFFDILLEPKLKRQQKLYEEKELVCKCTRCEDGETISQDQRKRLLSSSDFQHIALDRDSDNGDPKIEMEKCKSFLRMSGQVRWCNEVGLVVNRYVDLLRQRLVGKVNFATVKERVDKDLFKNLK